MGLSPERKKRDLYQGVGRLELCSQHCSLSVSCCFQAVLLEEHYQVEGVKINQLKTLVALAKTETNLRDQEKVKEPKVVRELRGSRPKSCCEYKIFLILLTRISD